MRAPLAFALTLLAAGCVEPAAGPGAPAAAADPQAADLVVQTFRESFTLTINPDPEAIAYGGASMDCVLFWDTDGADYHILHGNATLSWDALPNTERLRLVVTGAEEDVRTDTAGSPVHLALEDLAPGHPWGLGFWADYTLADATLPVLQEATLELEFAWEGDLPEPAIGTCAGGGA